MPTLKDGTKPRIFLLDDPAREKAHATNYTKEAEALKEYSLLVEAIYPIVMDHVLLEEALNSITSAFESRFKFVWETAGRYLMSLSHYFPNALERSLSLAKAKKSSMRLRVIQSQFSLTLPEPFLTEVLKAALSDPSAQVRQFAAIRCGNFRRADLLSALQTQLAQESATKVKESLEYAIAEINAPDA